MPLDPKQLLSGRLRGESVSWDERDVLLYALGIGMGRDPRLRAELAFVYEGAGLKVLPSFASLLASTRLLDDCGWDDSQVLHAGERLLIHRPLSDVGGVTLDSRVASLRDLGAERGALIQVDTDARGARGDTLFTVQRTMLARADGGCGGSTDSGPAPHPLPDRRPDLACALETRPDQALLYRLSGDRNPLHADPRAARAAGFDRPLLHGLCTWGIACRGILATICEYDVTLMRSMDGRFSAPAYPGDTLVTEMWQQANVVSFRVRAAERDVVVLNHGRCELAT
ncbi:MAG: MaoC family dehydratase N-terminal domain-containing protein [Chromatiales bacterium]|nr:MAG: MaoC family dehydratase N-terminal domain-containing protein [Chromatiales bacterium]